MTKTCIFFLVAQQLKFSVGFLVFQDLDYTNKLIAIFFFKLFLKLIKLVLTSHVLKIKEEF